MKTLQLWLWAPPHVSLHFLFPPSPSPNTRLLLPMHRSLLGFPHPHYLTPPSSSLLLLLLASLAPACLPGGFSLLLCAQWKWQPLTGLPLMAWSKEGVLYGITSCCFLVNNHSFKKTPTCFVSHLCPMTGNVRSMHAGT